MLGSMTDYLTNTQRPDRAIDETGVERHVLQVCAAADGCGAHLYIIELNA